LFDTLIDVCDGYEVLIDRADPSIKTPIQDVADQHTKDIAEIETVAKTRGMELDRSGTLMSEVHKAAIKMRDLFSDIDQDVLTAVGEGEKSVLCLYDSAIKELPETHRLHGILNTQRQELRGKINALFEAA
jgi:uncharacterized protein (TIGR02284 family)